MDIMENQQVSKEFVDSSKVGTSSPIPIKKQESTLYNMSGGEADSYSSSKSTPSSSPSSNGSWTPDIFNILSSLTNWLKGIEENKVSEEEYKFRENELWNDWEWILSTTEEFLIKQNQTENARVLGELDILKKAASNLKVKPIFINRANNILKEQFSQEDLDILASSSLDPNKRLGIITTAINTIEIQWLNYIKEKYFYDELNNNKEMNDKTDTNENELDENNNNNNNKKEALNDSNNETQFELAEDGWEDNLNNSTSTTLNGNINVEETKDIRNLDKSTTFDMVVLKKNINKITWEQFMENFNGSKYSKGVHGRMKDLGWQASHGVDGSLNARVIGDVSWSIWNTLLSAIKQIREQTPEESNQLIDIVCQHLQPMLAKMWLDTKKNSRIGVMNEGIVVEKWKQEETKKKKKILEMKKSGTLDKYNPEKVKVLDHERKEISQIRLNLEKKLKLKNR